MSVDLSPLDGTGTHLPVVVANMNAVAGKRMAESVARRGGVAIIPQDMAKEKMRKIIAYQKSRHHVFETPVIIDKDVHIQHALGLLHKRPHRAAVVIDDAHKPIGIFSDTDAHDQDKYQRVEQVMSEDVVVLQDGLSVKEMFQKLDESRLEFAPVTNTDGQLVGAVTKKGLVRSDLFPPSINNNDELMIGVAVGINGDVAAKVDELVQLGVDVIVLDTAHGHQQKMIDAVKTARKTAPKALLVAGNVVTAKATKDLIEAGADIVKVGVGPGAMCTTRMMTGVGRPQFSAVKECADQARKLGKSVWADGGVKHPRDVALALAAGAANVMFASWLAGTYESAADMMVDSEGRMYKESYGMASRKAVTLRNKQRDAFETSKKEYFEEGISSSKLYVNPKTPSVEDIMDQIAAGVRSSCTYAGATNLEEFYTNAIVGVQSAAGYNEGTAHTESW